VLSAGALRGLKDTRVPMVLAACAYWGVGMPLGAWLGLWLGWGPRGMWIGLIAGLVVAAILLGARFLRSSAEVRVATVTDGACKRGGARAILPYRPPIRLAGAPHGREGFPGNAHRAHGALLRGTVNLISMESMQ